MRLGLLTGSSAVALASTEAAIRLLVPKYVWEFVHAPDYWQSHPVMGWVQRPHLNITTIGEDNRPVTFRTNEDGLYPFDVSGDQRKGKYRILMIGDSTVVGRLVPQELSPASQLQRQLAARGFAAEVLCAAVDGYSTDQSLLRLRLLLPKYRPDLVTFGACLNDFDGDAQGHAHGFAKPRFELQPDGSLAHVPAPAPLPPVPSGSFAARLVRHSAIYRSAYPLLVQLKAPDNGRLAYGLDYEFHVNPGALERLHWPLTMALIREMRNEAETAGARFVFYSHPSRNEVWNDEGERNPKFDRYAVERAYATNARHADVAYCPQVAFFIANQHRGPFHLPRNPHCNSNGYALTAERLSDFVLEQRLLTA